MGGVGAFVHGGALDFQSQSFGRRRGSFPARLGSIVYRVYAR